MKSIMLSIRPKWVAKILNGEKTIEVRKKFPLDYQGWVYIYCTKDKDKLFQTFTDSGKYTTLKLNTPFSLNGKVVARFWCDKVEEYVNGHKWSWKSGSTMWGACNDYEYILKDTCLTKDELAKYVPHLSFYAIHISKLEIFAKPKELSEFKQPRNSYGKVDWKAKDYYLDEVSKAPQNYCHIEG